MISVCIATYNGEKFIEEQLKSILDQKVPVDEVIICDDCSTDNTPKIIKSFIEKNGLSESWHFFVNEKNVGFCLNFYGAIGKAGGDIIFLCDQDDIWNNDKVEVMSQYLMKNSDTFVLASRYQLIDEKGEEIKDLNIPYYSLCNDGSTETVDVNSLIGCSHIRGFSICFRSKIKEFLRPIDVKSLLAHDWYISIIGALLGKTVILNRILCKYRFHGNNTSLSDMNRKEFLGSIRKRILGIKESTQAHSYLLFSDIGPLQNKPTKALDKFIRFEEKRLQFLETKNPFIWVFLIFHINCYKRYYKSIKGAFRVLIGDFCYGYNINFKRKNK